MITIASYDFESTKGWSFKVMYVTVDHICYVVHVGTCWHINSSDKNMWKLVVCSAVWRCLPSISLAVLVTAVLKEVIIESMSVSSLLMMVRGANLLPIIAWKVSNMLGSFSFLRSNLSLVCFGLLIFSSEGGRSSSASRALPFDRVPLFHGKLPNTLSVKSTNTMSWLEVYQYHVMVSSDHNMVLVDLSLNW